MFILLIHVTFFVLAFKWTDVVLPFSESPFKADVKKTIERKI